ncbi:iron-sulfur cluster assembly scaffold protein [Epibacterium ulvae]|uniref:iron-sulfur cluster assembly scaffold protein n=1 Tax=Epibacterium ulvae TaxID=1156985 RepID=UPI001BFC881D|nr:iron-sulfur cluster assembly scaffold protein [Epibacterium ulvae]MBT8156020.1 iron-sulfur cluster assembly scaffold protein [Epibacterium ulvae]
MTRETDLIKLYSQRILELAADIPYLERLDDPDATAKKRSPLCGSTISVDLKISDGRISEFGQDVKACALGQAAAAVVGEAIIGRTQDELQTARNQLKNMLIADGPVPDPPFDGFEVLIPAREFKNRHASIMLALDASLAAMNEYCETV